MLKSNRPAQATETVVLVPGIYSPRLSLLPLAWRLRKQGYTVHLFSNRYLLKTPVENSQRLTAFLRQLDTDVLHLAGHSLGGIVIMNALAQNALAENEHRFAHGKVVLIASPVRGNAFARKMHSIAGAKWFLGRSATDGLLQAAPDNADGRDIGVITGVSPGGLVSLVYKPTEVNDGIVTSNETTLNSAKDTISVPQAHATTLFSKLCSELTLRFLQRSEFVAK